MHSLSYWFWLFISLKSQLVHCQPEKYYLIWLSQYQINPHEMLHAILVSSLVPSRLLQNQTSLLTGMFLFSFSLISHTLISFYYTSMFCFRKWKWFICLDAHTSDTFVKRLVWSHWVQLSERCQFSGAGLEHAQERKQTGLKLHLDIVPSLPKPCIRRKLSHTWNTQKMWGLYAAQPQVNIFAHV